MGTGSETWHLLSRNNHPREMPVHFFQHAPMNVLICPQTPDRFFHANKVARSNLVPRADPLTTGSARPRRRKRKQDQAISADPCGLAAQNLVSALTAAVTDRHFHQTHATGSTNAKSTFRRVRTKGPPHRRVLDWQLYRRGMSAPPSVSFDTLPYLLSGDSPPIPIPRESPRGERIGIDRKSRKDHLLQQKPTASQ
jgi:hypothetical protein